MTIIMLPVLLRPTGLDIEYYDLMKKGMTEATKDKQITT